MQSILAHRQAPCRVCAQVGGGCGLELGKERVRKMVQAFGGKVTSAVSGRTDILVVGTDPGFSKVDPLPWPSGLIP